MTDNEMDIALILEIASMTVNPSEAISDALAALERKEAAEIAAAPVFDTTTTEGGLAMLEAMFAGVDVAPSYETEKNELRFWLELVTFGGINKMTRFDAVQSCKAKISSAKNTIEKWSGRTYKNTTGSTWVGTEMEGANYSYSYINNARRDSHVRNAKKTIVEMNECISYYMDNAPMSMLAI